MSGPPPTPTRDCSATTLIGDSKDEDKPMEGYHPCPNQPLGCQAPVSKAAGNPEDISLTKASRDTRAVVVEESPVAVDEYSGRFRRLPKCVHWFFAVPRPLLRLFLNAFITLLWGIALAVFCAGVVPWDWRISQFLTKYDREWTNEVAALVGSLCKLHVAYVFQTSLELYSHAVIARTFTLKDLKWMRGVNEETIFAEFPDRPGAPPESNRPRGCLRVVERLWWSIYRFCSNKRLFWIVVWLGLLLHNTSIVGILQPEEFWKHVHFNDPVPCGVHSSALALSTERFLSGDEQQVLDKMSFEIGLQLGNYIDQVSGNTTTAVAGRKYRKDNFAYGAIGGLVEGLQDIPGVQYAARCTTSVLEANATWEIALPGVSPPTISPRWNELTNLPALPDNFRSVESHSPLSFNTSFFESAMYAVVDPLGNGALITVSPGAKNGSPLPLICSWTTAPKILHVEMVNFTALVLSHDPAEGYPSLIGRSTWATVEGMARASRLGASIQPDTLRYFRHGVTAEASTSYSFVANATTAQVVETILADGGKASMTKYNAHVRDRPRLDQSGRPMAFCDSKNKTVQEHWRFGNNKKIGWIAVAWTMGMGMLGMWSAVWISRQKRMIGVSPLGAAGGVLLWAGENIPEDQPLAMKHGKLEIISKEAEKNDKA